MTQRSREDRVTDTSGDVRQYLLASDFDQTLSFKDSGAILSELLGASAFDEKVAGLSRVNLVQQGGELAYLLLHDPEYRRVRQEHLVELGKRVRLKDNIRLLSELLLDGIDGHRFLFYVISAAPEEVVQSALDGLVPPDHVFGTRFRYDPSSGEIQSIVQVPAGYGKVAVLRQLPKKTQIANERAGFLGGGCSATHVKPHIKPPARVQKPGH